MTMDGKMKYKYFWWAWQTQLLHLSVFPNPRSLKISKSTSPRMPIFIPRIIEKWRYYMRLMGKVELFLPHSLLYNIWLCVFVCANKVIVIISDKADKIRCLINCSTFRHVIKLQKVTTGFVMWVWVRVCMCICVCVCVCLSVCPSVRLYGTNSFLSEWIFMKFDKWVFLEICQENSSLISIWQE
jgi:hypothetical protein